MPFDQPEDVIISMLQKSGADTVVTAPGAFPFDNVVKSYPALRQLIWVVDDGNKHLDWNEVPKGIGGSVNVSTWQDVLNDNPQSAGVELPEVDPKSEIQDVVFFWQSKPNALEEMVRFTQGNLVSAISAQLTAIPQKERFSPADLFLPSASLSSSFPLILTLAALYSNASVAFNSVAGTSPDLVLATAGVAPTIVVATPHTLAKTHAETAGKIASLLARLSHWVSTRSLVQNGAMPAASFLASYNDSLRPKIGTAGPPTPAPGKLRLLYVADPAGAAGAPRLSERTLSDLRVFTGARLVYALSAPKVAGAAAQTQFHDYRVGGDGDGDTHFGPPLSSAEIFLRDSDAHKITDESYTGEIVVRGPAVAGGEAALGIIGTVRVDNTLAYA